MLLANDAPFPFKILKCVETESRFSAHAVRIASMILRTARFFIVIYAQSCANVTPGSSTKCSFVFIAGSRLPEIPARSGRVVGVQGVEDVQVTIGQDLRVVEGVIVRMHCRATGFPRPSVRWFKNDYEVIAEGRFLFDDDNRLLVINGIRQDDTGQFACVAENVAGQAEESSFVSILSK